MPERSRLIRTLAEAFKNSGIQQVVIKEAYFVDRRPPLVPADGILSLVVHFNLGGATVQIIEALDRLIEDGRGSTKKLLITIGSNRLVDNEGNLIPDDDVTKLIWAARNYVEPSKKVESSGRTALVFGTVVYPPWSKEPIPIVLTITKPDMIREVIDGRIRGLAPQIRVKWFSCSICTENIEECEHKIGEKYDEKICAAIPRDIQFLEDSLTDEIVDSRCKVTDLLLIGKGGSECTWYGFQGVNILDRLKSINDAHKDEIITRAAATKFRFYFSRRSVGHSKYRKGEEEIKPSVTSHRKLTKE